MINNKNSPQSGTADPFRILPERTKNTDHKTNIGEIRSKLADPEYMAYAIYRLAIVITDKIFNLRGEM